MIQTLFGSVEQEPSLLDKLKSGVAKTRLGLVNRLEDALQGKKEIDADLLDELEYTLIGADIGVNTTQEILDRIRERADRQTLADPAPGSWPDSRASAGNSASRRTAHGSGCVEPPAVVMVVGVNGAGKTTTIGKLANRYRAEGRSVLLCAADTFRAAAIDQLGDLGQAHRHGSDSPATRVRPERGAFRRVTSGSRAQGGLRDRRYRGPSAD